MLCCTQQFECVSSHSVAKPHSRSVTPNRPTFARLHHTNPALLRTCQFLMIFCNIELSFQFCAHLFCRPHLPKMPHRLQFLTFWNANRALAITSCTFFWDRAGKPQKQRPYFGHPRSHTLYPKKNTVSRPKVHLSPMKSHASECLLYSSLLLPHANCSCSLCCWYDDHMMTWWWSLMTWWKDCPWTFVRDWKFSN